MVLRLKNQDFSPKSPDEKFVILGRIGAPFGIRGWSKIISFTDPISNILHYQPWYIWRNNQWHSVIIENAKEQHKSIVVKLQTCDDRNLAQTYTNLLIGMPRSQLPDLEPHEYYWSDLEGLTVTTTTGVELGVIDYLFSTGANDVIVVKGKKQHLLPYVPGEVIITIDLANKSMVVNWDENF